MAGTLKLYTHWYEAGTGVLLPSHTPLFCVHYIRKLLEF